MRIHSVIDSYWISALLLLYLPHICVDVHIQLNNILVMYSMLGEDGGVGGGSAQCLECGGSSNSYSTCESILKSTENYK